MTPLGSAFGSHILADLYGVAPDLLRDRIALESLLRTAALGAGAQVLGSRFHSFGAGDGVTGVVLLAESHISIHTWPESAFAAADIFMCGAADSNRALAVLLDAFAPVRQHIETVERGLAGAMSIALRSGS
jgi:S-adenosylmethionine decarboxylase